MQGSKQGFRLNAIVKHRIVRSLCFVYGSTKSGKKHLARMLSA